jgi:hypothetical protein
MEADFVDCAVLFHPRRFFYEIFVDDVFLLFSQMENCVGLIFCQQINDILMLVQKNVLEKHSSYFKNYDKYNISQCTNLL